MKANSKKSSNDKNLSFIHYLTKKIAEYSTIIIHRHINPDGDAYGAQLGLKYIIEANWKGKKVFISGKREVPKGMKEKTFSKLSCICFLDNLKEEDYHNSLVIIVDTASEERIDGEFWNRGKEIIKIDHHPQTTERENYAAPNNTWIEEGSSSCSQMIAKWALLQNLKIPKKASQALYFGIVTDTGRFLYISEKKDGEKTLAIASELLSNSFFDLTEFYQTIYSASTEEEIRIKGFIYSNLQISDQIAYCFIKPSDFRGQGWKSSRDHVISFVNLLGEIEKVKIWALFVADEITNDGEIRGSLRSKSEKYPVNEVAKINGHGGHSRAAGIKLAEGNWVGAKKIVNELKNLLKKKGCARGQI